MVADRLPTRENPSLTCGFSHGWVAPGMPGATLSGWHWGAPADNGWLPGPCHDSSPATYQAKRDNRWEGARRHR
jgi:hypothetical protein